MSINSVVEPLFVDPQKNPPHGFSWYYWRQVFVTGVHCFYAVGVQDDFGDLVPVYLPYVLALKHEGH